MRCNKACGSRYAHFGHFEISRELTKVTRADGILKGCVSSITRRMRLVVVLGASVHTFGSDCHSSEKLSLNLCVRTTRETSKRSCDHLGEESGCLGTG